MTRSRFCVFLLALTFLATLGESARGIVAAQQQQLSDAVLAQIAALAQDKATRTPAERKISSRLLYAIKMQRGEPIAPGVQLRSPLVQRDAAGRIDVDITARAGTNLRSLLTANGANVVGVNVAARAGGGAGGGSTARAFVDADRVMTLAARPDITSIQPHHEYMLSGAAQIASSMGSVSSEGDAAHRADLARDAFGVDGTGIRIGVLSDGVQNLAASQASGDLGPVTVLPGQTGTGDEGTAMLEIIHDLAPGAELYFATGTSSIAQFAQNIRDLRAAGCDIIVDDIFWFAESPFHDGQPASNMTSFGGVITQAVNDVTAAGALYFSSAGNSGNLSDGTSGVWEGDFTATATPPVLAGAGPVNDFGGGQGWNTVASSGSMAATLHWTDPLGASGNDYDIYILDSTGTTIVDASTNVQDGDDDPIEGTSAVFANERVVVALFSGSARFLHLNVHRAKLSIATAGQTHGHSAAAAAFSVAATPAAASFSGTNPGPYPGAFTTGNTVETFSSDGPRRLFYNANGTPFTPGNLSSTGGLLRQKPDLTAADGVQVTGAGGFGSPFYGTSASAPHAAAIAALLKEARPAATPAEIRTWLTSSALDIETAGVDRDAGAGIVMPTRALLAAGLTGTPILAISSYVAEENPGNGDGMLYGGEGGRLTVGLTNAGFSTATAIEATLTTTTPGVIITAPATRTYPDLAASATANASSPFTFTLPSNAVCGATVDFTLSVTRAGAPPVALPISVPTGVVQITQTFDGAAASVPPIYTATAGQQSRSLTRNGTASTCGANKPFPGSSVVAPTLGYEAYTFTTCPLAPPSCATVSLAAPSGSSQQLFSTAHTGSFNPDNLAAGYAGDLGQTHTDGAFASYGINLGAGSQTFTVAVSEITSSAAIGATYGLRVSGACLASCTRNRVPIAIVHDVTLTAGPGNVANGSINNGSNDPDGDPLTITASPAGPYPLGTTSVRLTVTDDKGATSQATANVTVVPAPPAVTVTGLSPARGAMAGGTIVTITGSGFSTLPGATTVRFGSTAATNVTCASATTCVATSPAGSGTVSVRASVADQTSADTAADDFAYATQVYLLAEGATGAFFDEDVAIANPNPVPAPITAAFYTESGTTIVQSHTLPAQSRLTINVDTVPGLEATSAAAAITSEQGLPLSVERTMFWDASRYAGHTGPAQAAPSTQWYFGEGAQGFFDTYVLVNNPNGTPTDVTFTFLREHESPVIKTVTVPGTSRYTLAASSVDGLADRAFAIAISSTQPVTTDRAMYFGTTPTTLFGGGMTSPGVALSPVWHFAEGATGAFFDTFFLLGNPQSTAAHVTLRYLLDTGEVITAPVTIPGSARLTINPEASPGIGSPDARLQNAQFAISITSDVPIVAERSMYWGGKAIPWGEGHSSPGLTAPALTWDLAEGRTGGAHEFHTYILLSNPQTAPAEVMVTYLREAGAPSIVKTYTVPATARLTIDVNAVPELANEAAGARVAVTNNMPIIVERSMYWNANGIFWSGGSNGMGIPVP